MNQPIRDPHTVPVQLCESTDDARAALANLRHADAVAIDTETEILRDEDGKALPVDFDVDGPGPWRVMSIAARFGDGEDAVYRAWVLDMKYVVIAMLVDLFTGVRPWGWNANFDRFVIARGGLLIRKWWDGTLFDAVIKMGAYYATGGRPWYTSLENAAAKWLGISAIEGKTDVRYEYTMATDHLTEQEVRYAADDAIVTLWAGEVLIEEAKQQDLYETAVRECDAQPFIDSMAKNGLPLDVNGYQAVIDTAQRKADEAAEKIAVATTGKELLTTVGKWAGLQTDAHIQTLAQAGGDDVAAVGMTVLKDPEVFGMFIAALRAQLEVCREQMAQLTGAGAPVEDLFSNTDRWELPFDPDDDATVKKWISKSLPTFTKEYIASVGTTNKQLVKAHDLTDVLARLTQSQLEEVTDEHRQLAIVIASYLRYARIVTTYGDTVGAVWLKPDWNINSGDQVKAMLNQFSTAEVQAYTAKKDGQARLLGKADSVDSDALTLIGGDLCEALLTFREHNKMVTTYGDDLLKFVHKDTGRIHGKYTQGLTGTGRLASHSPNMQNLSPLMKIHARPNLDNAGRVMRVLVCADLSQAELRSVAHMAQDINMLEAFRSGEDLHERTASLMFTIDLKTVKARGSEPLSQLTDVQGVARYAAEDPDKLGKALYKTLRQKAKSVAFGYAYGLKGGSLSRQLTVQGVPTTKEEADELLAAFDRAYPQLAAWMAQRVAFIQSLSDQMKDIRKESGCDFDASLRLHKLYAKSNSAYKALTNKLGRKPSMVEVAEHLVPAPELVRKLAAGKVTAEKVAAVLTALDVTTADMDDEQAMLNLHQTDVVPAEQRPALLELIKAHSLHTVFPPEHRTPAAVEEFLCSLIVTEEMVSEARRSQAENIAWALGHYGSAVLATDGSPWSFESRTLGNRRRLFQIGTKDWVFSMVQTIARSRKQHAAAVRNAWVEAYNAEVTAEHAALVAAGKANANSKPKTISLSKVNANGRNDVLSREELEKVFENEDMKLSFVEFVLASYDHQLGEAAAGAKEFLFRYAMADRIRAMGNQYRNQPIQGLVADGMERSMGLLVDALPEQFPTAKAVQSVHDSIVVDCDLADAKGVRDLVVSLMEGPMSDYCPSVPIRADGDVQLSLDDKTIITDEQIDQMLAELQLQAA